MKISRENYDKLVEKVGALEKAINGGKGSGNFGHAGRPGEVGGSSTTSRRLARKDRVAELKAKAEETGEAYDEYQLQRGSEGYDEAKAEQLRQEHRKAQDEYDTADREDMEESRKEVMAGMDKKRKKDTPGKKETAKVLKEAESDLEARENAFQTYYSADKKNAENTASLKADYEKKYKKSLESLKKLEKAVSNQMVNDKQFVNDLKEHIEQGLGIKLGNDFKLEVKPYSNSDKNTLKVESNTKLSPKDLGAFSKLVNKATVNLFADTSLNRTTLGTMYGRVDLKQSLRSGLGRTTDLFDVQYAPEGTYLITDRRNHW